MYKNLRAQTLYELKREYPDHFAKVRPFAVFRWREWLLGYQSALAAFIATSIIATLLVSIGNCAIPSAADHKYVNARISNIAILISISFAAFTMVMNNRHSLRLKLYFIQFRESYVFPVLYFILFQIALLAMINNNYFSVEGSIYKAYSVLALGIAMTGICIVFYRILKLSDFSEYLKVLGREYEFIARKHFAEHKMIEHSEWVLRDFCRVANIQIRDYYADLRFEQNENPYVNVSIDDLPTQLNEKKFLNNIKLDCVYIKVHNLPDVACYLKKLDAEVMSPVFWISSKPRKANKLNRYVTLSGTPLKNNAYEIGLESLVTEAQQGIKDKDDKKIISLLSIISNMEEIGASYNQLNKHQL